MNGSVFVGGEAHVGRDAGDVAWDGEVFEAHRGAFGWAEQGMVMGE